MSHRHDRSFHASIAGNEGKRGRSMRWSQWRDASALGMPQAIKPCPIDDTPSAAHRVSGSCIGSSGAAKFGRRATLGSLGAGIAAFLARRARADALLPPLSDVLMRLQRPQVAPPVHFTTAQGERRTPRDYRGKGLVLNIWATWCPPCRAELPTLDHLAENVASDGIVVLPVSIDRGGLKAVAEYFAKHHITHLPIVLDPDGGIITTLHVPGTPTTFLIDRHSRIVGFVEGPAEWDAPASVTLLRQLIGPSESAVRPA